MHRIPILFTGNNSSTCFGQSFCPSSGASQPDNGTGTVYAAQWPSAARIMKGTSSSFPDLWGIPFMLHSLVMIFSTPNTHIMSVHFPTDIKSRLITKHNTINKTFLRHCILHLNAKVTSVDVVCRFQKLQKVKTLGLHVLSLSQHLPHSHTRHLQFTTRTAHRFIRTAKRRLSHSFHVFSWHTAAVLHFSLYKGTPLSETADTSV